MRRQHYGAVARGSNEEEPLLVPGPEEVKIFPEQWRKAPGWIFVFVLLGLFIWTLLSPGHGTDSTFESRVWASYNRSALDDVRPISAQEFLARQDELAQVLKREKVDAFIAEPGGTTQYYANFSKLQWELSERPFLLVATPKEVFYLAPLFEVSRAKMLSIPSSEANPRFITWAEDISPYKTLLDNLPKDPKIVMDDHVRSFIFQGLSENGATVLPQSPDIAAIRETKSSTEIDILRAVNIATVEAIRAIQNNILLGMPEKMIRETLDRVITRAGMTPYFNVVLFGSDAANPHGGVDEARELNECEFILIDVGAVFHGYSSDITRTFLPRGTDIEECFAEEENRSLQEIWKLVHDAQTAGIEALTTNHTCAEVDLAARKVIEDADLGKHFSHRLGHGLGVEGHERPYLNKGNTKTRLREGNVFTVEPGVYIEDYAGVRLEDVVVVTEEGPEILSGRQAKDWLDI